MGEERQFFLMTRKHSDPQRAFVSQEVLVCTVCGVVYTWKPHRLGQCPLGHDQKRPNKEDYVQVSD